MKTRRTLSVLVLLALLLSLFSGLTASAKEPTFQVRQHLDQRQRDLQQPPWNGDPHDAGGEADQHHLV